MPRSSRRARRPTGTSATATAASTTARTSGCTRRSWSRTTSAHGATSCGRRPARRSLRSARTAARRPSPIPTFTPLTLPNGESGVVVTQFIPLSGAAPGEAGELVYYRPRNPPPPAPPPTIAAAGDISCTQNTTCHDDETSNLLVADPPTRVLTLGDNQYENGELANFQTYYQPDWGRLKSITMPTPRQSRSALVGLRPVLRDARQLLVRPRRMAPDLARLDRGRRRPPRSSPTTSPSARTAASSPTGTTRGSHRAAARQQRRDGSVLGPPVRGRRRRVLVGHEHIYERFAPQTPAAVASPTGIRQFTVGTGGRALHAAGTVRANSEVRIFGRFGVLRMTLHPTSYDWRFVGEDGVTYDSGSTNCS